VRRRVGNFILAEDDQTLEGVVLQALAQRSATLAVAESFTGGQIAARLSPLAGAEAVFRRGIVSRDPAQLRGSLGLAPAHAEASTEAASEIAEALREKTGADHALAVLVDLDDGTDRIELGGTICIAVSAGARTLTRHSRLLGGREWVRLGAIEMGLDCLRRYLQGLPIDEKIDFEKK